MIKTDKPIKAKKPIKKGMTVRFADHEMALIDGLADRYKVTSATVIRWAIRALNEYADLHQGKITLPLDFSSFYALQPAASKSHAPTLSMVAEDPKPYLTQKQAVAQARAAKTKATPKK